MTLLTRRKQLDHKTDTANAGVRRFLRLLRPKPQIEIPEESVSEVEPEGTTTDDVADANRLNDNTPGTSPAPPWWSDWQEWSAARVPRMLSVPPAYFHEDLWDWGVSLKPGVKPYAYIAPWGRGLGKSSSAEAIIAYLEEASTRKFILYVCATQDAANEHLSSIATILEARPDNPVERLVNKFGHSRGYTQSRIRIRKPGGESFNIIAFGLDSVRRGLKLDNMRPDAIFLDDIDDINDTAAEAMRMFRTITRTVIPTGATDCAICFIQNPIHPNSVMSRLLRGEFKGLMRRRGGKLIPSLTDFTYEEIVVAGQPEYKITSGKAVWEGFSVEDAEAALNESGPDAFKAEYLHEFNSQGLLFSYFAATRDSRPWHVQNSFPIPDHWQIFGSHDYGESAPCASLIYARDEHGDIYIIAENYMTGLTSQRQAGWFCRLLWTLGLGYPVDTKEPYGKWKTRCKYIAFDHANTFPALNKKEIKSEYPIQVWFDMGLMPIRSDKERIPGWRRMNEWFGAVRAYFDEKGVVRVKPRIIIFGDRCPNLCRLLPLAPVREDDPRELDKSYEAHGIDSLRYFIMSLEDEPRSTGSRVISASHPEDPFAEERPRFVE